MKKRRFFFLVVAACIFFSGCSKKDETSYLTGYCLAAENGSYLIVDNQHSVIVMNDQTADGLLFKSLESGDEIQITCGTIRETYPAQTEVSGCVILEKGKLDEISPVILSSLEELGWKIKLPQ